MRRQPAESREDFLPLGPNPVVGGANRAGVWILVEGLWLMLVAADGSDDLGPAGD